MGYIDVDVNDGTWDRLVDRCLELIYQNNENVREYWDYLDIYSVSHITLNRYQYICPYDEDGWAYTADGYKEAVQGFHEEYTALDRKCYEKIFNDNIIFINGKWQAHIDDDIKLLMIFLNDVPLPNQPQTLFLGTDQCWKNTDSNRNYPEQFKNVYYTWCMLSTNLDSEEESYYKNYPPEFFFTATSMYPDKLFNEECFQYFFDTFGK